MVFRLFRFSLVGRAALAIIRDSSHGIDRSIPWCSWSETSHESEIERERERDRCCESEREGTRVRGREKGTLTRANISP